MAKVPASQTFIKEKWQIVTKSHKSRIVEERLFNSGCEYVITAGLTNL